MRLILKLRYHFRPYHLLFLFIPISLVSSALAGRTVATFGLSILALVPISILMGQATEELALHIGPLAGGLLNATFGNAAELIVGVLGLRAGLTVMVKASLTGSVIGELLLVLGMGALAGGTRYKEQSFGRSTGSLMSTLMLLAVIGLVVPAVFANDGAGGVFAPGKAQALSTTVAVILLVTYSLGLLFSLKTHQSLFNECEPDDAPPATWSKTRALGVLMACTLAVFVESELVVESVQVTAQRLGLTQIFIGVVIIAIVGNAAEHATAVWMAYKGRMDICVNVAIGSSAQVALFVAPVLVIMSLTMRHPMDLVFSRFELVAVALSVAVAHFVALDGKTNWFEGVQLLAVYLILATGFYFLPG